MITRVCEICDAYESGFGHGLVFDNLPNPYRFPKTPEEYEAYFIGYEKAADRKHEADDRHRLIKEDETPERSAGNRGKV